MPTTSPRPPVDSDTVDLALAYAATLGIPATSWMGAAIESQVGDAVISARAQRELDAWTTGTAVPIPDLVLPTAAAETLVLSLRPWVDDEISEPYRRAGYGVRAGELGRVVAPSARGLWNVQPRDHTAKGAESDGVRVVAFRRGLPVLHAWGKNWTAEDDAVRPRRWAKAFYVADAAAGRWVDVDTDEGGPDWDDVDQAVDDYLGDLVVIGRWNRNGVNWVRGAAV